MVTEAYHNAQVRVRREHFSEAQDVAVRQAPVVQDFPLHVLVQEHICGGGIGTKFRSESFPS